jgi:hypothetical protein
LANFKGNACWNGNNCYSLLFNIPSITKLANCRVSIFYIPTKFLIAIPPTLFIHPTELITADDIKIDFDICTCLSVYAIIELPFEDAVNVKGVYE